MDSVDDLGAVDALEVDRRDVDAHVPELALETTSGTSLACTNCSRTESAFLGQLASEYKLPIALDDFRRDYPAGDWEKVVAILERLAHRDLLVYDRLQILAFSVPRLADYLDRHWDGVGWDSLHG